MAIFSMPARKRLIRVDHVMGTVISIDVRDTEVREDSIDAAFAWLRRVDERFSPFKPDSEITRLGRGELTLDECHADVAEVLELCEELRINSGGAFNAWRARADGRLDPSGVVKGWSAQRAARILERSGARNYCINAGGDIIACGVPEPGRPWRVGIRHPQDGQSVAVVLAISGLAVATSGSYERGHHILDGRTGEPASSLRSLTVAGPSMTLADAYATAGFAMGEAGIVWAGRQKGYAACGVTSDARLRYSDGFAELIAAPLTAAHTSDPNGQAVTTTAVVY